MQILNINSLLNVYFLVASRPLSRPSDWRMCLGKHHMNSSMDVPSAEECYKVDHIIKHEGFVYEQDKSGITNVMPPPGHPASSLAGETRKVETLLAAFLYHRK